MLDLLVDLPVEVEVKGEIFTITNKCDWRTMIKCSDALADESVNEELRTLSVLTMFYDQLTIENIEQYAYCLEDLIKSMFYVLSYGNLKPGKAKKQTVDFNKDIRLILEGISMQHGEIRGQYLHWWTFLDYFHGIKDSTFNTIVSIRYKQSNGKKLDQWEKDFLKENRDLVKI